MNGNKSLFGVTEGIICQQCNCKGAYGAGLSGAIASQYPEVLLAFESFNKQNPNNPISGNMRIGKHQVVPLTQETDLKGHRFLAVANIYTQNGYGNSEKTGIKYTDTDKLVDNIKKIALFYKDIPVFVPHSVDKSGNHSGIGCGLAGEKWENLYPLLQNLKLPNLYMLNTFTGEREQVKAKLFESNDKQWKQMNIKVKSTREYER